MRFFEFQLCAPLLFESVHHFSESFIGLATAQRTESFNAGFHDQLSSRVDQMRRAGKNFQQSRGSIKAADRRAQFRQTWPSNSVKRKKSSVGHNRPHSHWIRGGIVFTSLMA